jgi:hypothetical protein
MANNAVRPKIKNSHHLFIFGRTMPLAVYFKPSYTASGIRRPAPAKTAPPKKYTAVVAVAAVSYIKLPLPPLPLCFGTYKSLAAKFIFLNFEN